MNSSLFRKVIPGQPFYKELQDCCTSDITWFISNTETECCILWSYFYFFLKFFFFWYSDLLLRTLLVCIDCLLRSLLTQLFEMMQCWRKADESFFMSSDILISKMGKKSFPIFILMSLDHTFGWGYVSRQLWDEMKILFSCWLLCEEHVIGLWVSTGNTDWYRGSSVTKLNLN